MMAASLEDMRESLRLALTLFELIEQAKQAGATLQDLLEASPASMHETVRDMFDWAAGPVGLEA